MILELEMVIKMVNVHSSFQITSNEQKNDKGSDKVIPSEMLLQLLMWIDVY